MNRATAPMRKLARRIIALEAGYKSLNAAHFQVCENLRPQLATLVGNEAFRALLAHALALATAEVPALRAVRVKEDGTLEASDEIHEQINADIFFEGRIVLVAQLLGLLVAFIGENLTLRLLYESWPKVTFTSLDLDKGEKNETKK